MKKIINWLNKIAATTAIGSLLKTFFFGMVAFFIKSFMDSTTFFALNKTFFMAMLWSGIIAVINVLHNWFNPHYEGYGMKPKLSNLKADKVV